MRQVIEVFESGIFSMKVWPVFGRWYWELWLDGDRELVDSGSEYVTREECIRSATLELAAHSKSLVGLSNMIDEALDED